jgi:Domain of unknown function (DUF5011)
MKMKKLLILSVIAAVTFVGCKKKENTDSIVVTKSVPTITITGSQYVSIPVGGSFTPPAATAYDSFYKEKLTVVKDLGTLNNTKPGLYVVAYSAKNKYGFVGTANVYVAVTNVSDTLDLSGWYLRLANPNRVAFVTKLATGLFRTSNVGGVDTGDVTTGPVVSAVFAVTSTTMLTFGTQTTSDGPLSSNSEALSLAPADTTLTYAIQEASFGTQVRSFKKQ